MVFQPWPGNRDALFTLLVTNHPPGQNPTLPSFSATAKASSTAGAKRQRLTSAGQPSQTLKSFLPKPKPHRTRGKGNKPKPRQALPTRLDEGKGRAVRRGDTETESEDERAESSRSLGGPGTTPSQPLEIADSQFDTLNDIYATSPEPQDPRTIPIKKNAWWWIYFDVK